MCSHLRSLCSLRDNRKRESVNEQLPVLSSKATPQRVASQFDCLVTDRRLSVMEEITNTNLFTVFFFFF